MLIRRFVSTFHKLFQETGSVGSVLEVGCGEGFLSGYLSELHPEIEFTGVDICPEAIAGLKAKFPRVNAYEGSAYDLSTLGDATFDLVFCAEVLEHLEEPDLALQQILSRQPQSVILTVPHEPFFMLSNLLRGKDVLRLGNNPEHINHFSKRSFRRWLAGTFDVSQVTTSYPWLLAHCRPKQSSATQA